MSMGGSEVFEMKKGCGLSSTTVTQDASFPFGLSGVQYISASSDGSFLLPLFTSSNPSCPIISREISNLGSVVNLPSTDFVGGITQDANLNWIVKPDNSNVDAVYEFYIKASAEGGAIKWSSLFVLHVGCTLSGVTITDGAILMQKDLIVGTDLLDVYEYALPSISPSYCPISNIYIESLTKNGESSSNGVINAASCTSLDCRMLDLTDNDNTDTIEFKIRTRVKGGVEHLSDKITLNLKCDGANIDLSS